MNSLLQDVRYGLRILAKNPAFVAVAVITLGLSIGASTAIFSAVNGVLLRPLGVFESERLITVWIDNRIEGWPHDLTSYPNFEDWRQNEVFEDLAAHSLTEVSLTGWGEPERLRGANVSGSLFSIMRVTPFLGSTFDSTHDKPGTDLVAVLSHGLWQRRFGSDPSVIGRSISLNGAGHTIIGVLPSEFDYPGRAELYLPFSTIPTNRLQARGALWLRVTGRLRPGVTLDQARAEMNIVAERLAEQYPDANRDLGINLVPLQEHIVGKVQPTLMMLLGAVTFVLLIACANLANLLLARGAVREKEIALRAALGARRIRLVRQLLTESLILALAGGALGLGLAYWGIDLLRTFSPANLPRTAEINIDSNVLLFTTLVAVVTGLLFGLFPAIRGSRPDLNESLKEGGRAVAAPHQRLRNALVVAEVALSLVLLVGAGLLIRSFMRLMAVDPGFRPDNLLTMDITIPNSKYPQASHAIEFYRQLIERTIALPGVVSAGIASDVPVTGREFPNSTSFTAEGRVHPAGLEQVSVNVAAISTEYFQTIGVQLIRGRWFNDHDTPEGEQVVIINDTMARLFWPGDDPLGKRMKYGGQASTDPWKRIVGIVGNLRDLQMEKEPRPASYRPQTQAAGRSRTLVVRTVSEPAAMTGIIRKEILNLDPDQPVSNITTMAERIERSIAARRFTMLLLGVFAGLALLLAAIGMYGLLSYAVSQRTHEIGIRMALGAQSGQVRRMVVRQGMLLVLAGIVLGIGGSLALSTLISTLLYEIRATDPLSSIAAALVLGIVAFFACYVPARRATRVDPVTALRYE
jgi:putative ABC transport system permease protein